MDYEVQTFRPVPMHVNYPVTGITRQSIGIVGISYSCIYVMEFPRLWRTQAYLICLGTENNQKTVVTEADGAFYHEFSTPDILHPADIQYFWLEFNVGTLRFGKGSRDDRFGGQMIFDLQNLTTLHANFLSFSGEAAWYLKGVANDTGRPRISGIYLNGNICY